MSRHGRRNGATLATALTAGAVALTAAAPASAQLAIETDHVEAAELSGNGNAVIEPGERAGITQVLVYSDFTDLVDLTGTLGAPSADTAAVVEQATANWPLTTFGYPSANTSPFVVAVDQAHPCGVPLRFTLTLASSAGGAELATTVPTGSAGTASPVATTTPAIPIPDAGGWVEQYVTLDAPGRVKALKVAVSSIRHSYSGDLRLTLIAPDGRSVVLADQRGDGADDAFVGTVFSDDGAAPVMYASAPFGDVRPEQPLSTLDGAVAAGTWALRVEDRTPGSTGVMDGWSLQAPPAQCTTTTPTPTPTGPGATSLTPGQGGATPPGQGGTAPGQAKPAAGKSGSAPGRSK